MRAQWSGTSDQKYVADNVAAKTSLLGVNGTTLNGETSRLYFRNTRILEAFDDEYGGVIIDPDRLPSNPSAFAPSLSRSLSHWKKMVKSRPHLLNSHHQHYSSALCI